MSVFASIKKTSASRSLLKYHRYQVLKTLNHPNIIHLEDTYESADRIYMVMEMMMGGELFDYVVEKGTLSEEEASVIVRKVTSAVAHMHGLDIIHRDLKPENLVRGYTNEMAIS
jgi:calcium/calmodulin-dependent protein kinase I